MHHCLYCYLLKVYMLLSSTLNGNWVRERREFECKDIIQLAFNTVYEKNVTCKRDPEARDRDIWLSVRDETETETFPHFSETETRPRRWENASRDRLETKTSRPRLHPCSEVYLESLFGSRSPNRSITQNQIQMIYRNHHVFVQNFVQKKIVH